MQNKVLALIPARSGSKTIKDKNIRMINRKPLIAYSIEHALQSKLINRVVVSTDSQKYAKIARAFGAETPFIRPQQFAEDFSTDLEVFQHALSWLMENENYQPDICVHLRPTNPIRTPADIDRMIDILIKDERLDSVRSVVAAPVTPFKMWFRDSEGMLKPVAECDIKEAFNAPRQALPQAFLQNASIDVVRTEVILKKKSMTGERIHGYVMNELFDIDTKDELKSARRYLKKVK